MLIKHMIEFTDKEGRRVIARLSSVTHINTDHLTSFYVHVAGEFFDVEEGTWERIREVLLSERNQ